MNRNLFIAATILILAGVMSTPAEAQNVYGRNRYAPDLPPGIPSGLDAWREKRTRDFWNPTSPFFGDPYYDPMKTSPLSPFRSPQFHPWNGSPFRGDPYYDPYAPRRGRFDYYRRRW